MAGRGRPKSSRKLKRVTLTINPEDWDQFEEIGSANGMSSAALVRLAMKEFLERRLKGKAVAIKLSA